jgi:hypothetical protein
VSLSGVLSTLSGFLTYLVRPIVIWRYPQTKIERHLITSLESEAQLFVTQNRLEISLLVLKNLTPFEITLTQIKAEVKIAGVIIGTTGTKRMHQRLKKSQDINFAWDSLQITGLGRQQIAEVRQVNGGTDFIAATTSIQFILRTNYHEFVIRRDFSMPIHVFN